MNAAYFHIISVHLPVIGTPILLIWVLSSFQLQFEKRWKWIYFGSLFLTFITSVSYFTGPSTADWIKIYAQDYPQDLIENHALWGRFGFILQIFTGLIGIMAFSNYLQDEKPSKKLPYILAILLFINTLILIYTAHLGGMIRRPDLLFA